MLEKRLNDFITLRLRDGKTRIYVLEKEVLSCKKILLNFSQKELDEAVKMETMDEVIYGPRFKEKRYTRDGQLGIGGNLVGGITLEEEFWAHHSNLQYWVEQGYDTKLVSSRIAFPLLKELAKAGDQVARKIYKREIFQRMKSNFNPVVTYLARKEFMEEFEPAEMVNLLWELKEENLEYSFTALFSHLISRGMGDDEFQAICEMLKDEDGVDISNAENTREWLKATFRRFTYFEERRKICIFTGMSQDVFELLGLQSFDLEYKDIKKLGSRFFSKKVKNGFFDLWDINIEINKFLIPYHTNHAAGIVILEDDGKKIEFLLENINVKCPVVVVTKDIGDSLKNRLGNSILLVFKDEKEKKEKLQDSLDVLEKILYPTVD